jgi:ABC-type Fe3+-siderophore transport system permease subunit
VTGQRWSNKTKRQRFLLVMLGGGFLLCLLAVLSLRLGAIPVPFAQMIDELLQKDGVIYDFRLPRLIIAVCVGMNMALSGSILQGVTRNPLAAPDLIGITAGGGLATVIMILAVPNYSANWLPFFAFGGSFAAAAIVFVLSYRKGIRPERLALCGVAVSSGIHALITLLIVKFAPSAAQALVWLKGSLYARTWDHVDIIVPWTVLGAILALISCYRLNILLLSEETIQGLGMKITRVRLYLIALSVILAGSAVAVAGTIGFIGLVIPHLTRLLVGSDYRLSLPASALLGAVLVTAADTIGRIVLPPVEISAGIVTALIGAPYFVYLLVRRKLT